MLWKDGHGEVVVDTVTFVRMTVSGTEVPGYGRKELIWLVASSAVACARRHAISELVELMWVGRSSALTKLRVEKLPRKGGAEEMK